MKVCTAAQMREIDRRASELGGIPGIVLMENAAYACLSQIEKLNSKKIGIFCGKGNNGGDGFAIARLLHMRNFDVEVFLVCGSDYSGDAEINFEIIEKTDIRITEITDTSLLEYYITTQDLIVDAIFGTGIRGEITGIPADVIEAINTYARFVLSVDIPSGVNADNGEISSVAVKADLTVTFAAYKCGLLLYPGADFAGRIITADISIPEYIINSCDISINIIDEKFAREVFPKRTNNSHKGDYGRVLLIGGSTGMTGAVALAANASVKSGAGLVSAGIPKSLNSIMEAKLTEPMTLPLSEEQGMLSSESFEEIFKKMLNSDVLLFGPGAGRTPEIGVLLEKILQNSKIPIILDADGLFALAQNPDMLESCGCNLIFTPHEMEFARLINRDADYVRQNRLRLSHDFAVENGVTLVLKGHHTIVTSPDGTQFININGNPGMATGGSGDVLAGIISSFVAAGLDDTHAAALGVFVHGRAGDIAAEKYGEATLCASDICDCIKYALLELSR